MAVIMQSVAMLFIFCLIAMTQKATGQNPVGRNYDRYEEVPEILNEPRKRPFCNAFTGCGRKRSSPPQQQLIQDLPSLRKPIMEDSMDTLMDMSSEPAVEDLSRQIMSEAKLWEAIQEAGAELARRRKFGH